MSEHKRDVSPQHRADVPTRRWPLLIPIPKASSTGEPLVRDFGDRVAVVVGVVAAIAVLGYINNTATDEHVPSSPEQSNSRSTGIQDSADITQFDPNAPNGVPFYNPDESGE